MSDIIKIDEAAQTLGMSKERVRHFAATGVLQGIKYSERGHWRFEREVVLRFRNEHTGNSGPMPHGEVR